MSQYGYQEIDHTADLALKVWGEDFKVLLQQAALGMYELMGVVMDEETQVGYEFSLEKATDEILLVDFLNELVYIAEDKGACFNTFNFYEQGDRWVVKCKGQITKSIKRYIKAVTFHDLEIHHTNQGLKTTITFDV